MAFGLFLLTQAFVDPDQRIAQIPVFRVNRKAFLQKGFCLVHLTESGQDLPSGFDHSRVVGRQLLSTIRKGEGFFVFERLDPCNTIRRDCSTPVDRRAIFR